MPHGRHAHSRKLSRERQSDGVFLPAHLLGIVQMKRGEPSQLSALACAGEVGPHPITAPDAVATGTGLGGTWRACLAASAGHWPPLALIWRVSWAGAMTRQSDFMRSGWSSPAASNHSGGLSRCHSPGHTIAAAEPRLRCSFSTLLRSPSRSRMSLISSGTPVRSCHPDQPASRSAYFLDARAYRFPGRR